MPDLRRNATSRSPVAARPLGGPPSSAGRGSFAADRSPRPRRRSRPPRPRSFRSGLLRPARSILPPPRCLCRPRRRPGRPTDRAGPIPDRCVEPPRPRHPLGRRCRLRPPLRSHGGWRRRPPRPCRSRCRRLPNRFASRGPCRRRCGCGSPARCLPGTPSRPLTRSPPRRPSRHSSRSRPRRPIQPPLPRRARSKVPTVNRPRVSGPRPEPQTPSRRFRTTPRPSPPQLRTRSMPTRRRMT